MKLKQIQVDKDSIFTPSVSLIQDLHIFVNYALNRYIKRTHRENLLPKADYNRLTKMIKTKNNPDQNAFNNESWIDFVDNIAYHMGLVSYDKSGEYLGYYSASLSYPDNYIEVHQKEYDEFLSQTPLQQEQKILSLLIENLNSCESEFFKPSPLGSLDTFDHYDCHSERIKRFNFPNARKYLLNVLKKCKSNVWYSTRSLIDYIKKTDPFFLISESIKKKSGVNPYGRFSEYKRNKSSYREYVKIKKKDKDAFERAEGRYIERFLESIPLIMNYIDIAYEPKKDLDVIPLKNYLKAFRVNDYFLRIINQKMSDPEVWIQPNFEIQVISEIYPGGLITRLSDFADVIKEDRTVTHLKLSRKKVLNQKLNDEKLDLVALLQKMSGKKLAQNVITEINGWCGQTDIFTLYEDVGLLETKSKKLQQLHNSETESITPTIQMIHSPDKVFKTLEKKENVPILVKHSNSKLKTITDSTFSVFSEKKKKTNKASKEKKTLTIKQQRTITLFFSLKEVFKFFQNRLIKARCPVESDSDKQSLTIPENHESLIDDIVKDLKKEYSITIQDISRYLG